MKRIVIANAVKGGEAAQNAQFVLNVLHWLSGLLPD
jgi:hypothetical protein